MCPHFQENSFESKIEPFQLKSRKVGFFAIDELKHSQRWLVMKNNSEQMKLRVGKTKHPATNEKFCALQF